jgi:hypothetical protein
MLGCVIITVPFLLTGCIRRSGTPGCSHHITFANAADMEKEVSEEKRGSVQGGSISVDLLGCGLNAKHWGMA